MREGLAVGTRVGRTVGVGVGLRNPTTVGAAVGLGVGETEGRAVGERVGVLVGICVVGTAVEGCTVGTAVVGAAVGDAVGVPGPVASIMAIDKDWVVGAAAPLNTATPEPWSVVVIAPFCTFSLMAAEVPDEIASKLGGFVTFS